MSQKNLKSILTKQTATFMATLLVLSNFSICGLGISNVIAEDTEVPSLDVDFKNSKYVQYQTEEYTGVAIESTVNVMVGQEKDKYLQAKEAEIQISLPKLNEHLPERANVVLANTLSTTGEMSNQNINQSYDKNSGLLNVAYENYNTTSFKENVKDEFEIIYIYPAEAYTGNSEEIKLNYSVNANLTFVKTASELAVQTSKTFELTQKDNVGDLTSFSVTELKNRIYKGFMYSNVKNETSYDTEFNTVSTLSILSSDTLINELNLNINENKFTTDNKEEILSNGDIVYTETSIDRKEFDKFLGKDGYIYIYQGEDEIAMISYDDTTSKLTIVYSEEEREPEVLEEDANVIKLTYGSDLTSLNIRTSKPITEGFMHFENKSVIKGSNDYGKDVKEIKNIKVTSTVKENTYDTYLSLLEPSTKISIELSNKNFSTLQSGKTTITVKLDDTNSYCELFDNPTIKIKLPEGIESGKVSSPEIVSGNGLSIDKTSISGNIITLELKGKQTEYDINNVSGGANIVMDIDNIKYNELQCTHNDKVTLTCTQNEKTTTSETDVSIVSKEGILLINRVTGYDELGSTVGGFDFTEKNAEVAVDASEKELTEEIILVNNNKENLENVKIMGSFTSTDSTFNLTLTDMTISTEDNAQVYFSNNINADFNDDSWSQTATNDSKVYKVVYPDNIMPGSANLKLTFKLKVPADLDFNEKAVINNSLSYKYQNSIFDNGTRKIVIATPVVNTNEVQNENLQLTNTTANEQLLGSSNENIILESPEGDGENDEMLEEDTAKGNDDIIYVRVEIEKSPEKEDEPVEDEPVENEPIEDTPTEDTPTEDTPTEDTPAENTPSKDTPTAEKQKYSISGLAWIDSNKNGQRDENEKLQDSVIVSLLDMETGNFALNTDGTKITTTTNAEGKYIFNNITEGEYAILFEFDNNSYTVTTYQKSEVDEDVNSDAILSVVTINGNNKLAAITDNINLNANVENIDLGLIENAEFDLSLDKKITNITVVNSKGTESYDYKNGDTAKVDLVAKYMSGAEVIVTYKFTITNDGDTVGYVDSLVDNLPSGLEFSSELNPKWYKGSDGSLYMTALSEKAIKPGESEEVELILTKTMTENNAGTFVNNAKLEKISNLENTKEKTEALENNNSSAILIISIKTGTVIVYTGITLICIAIIAAGVYVIKKRMFFWETYERRSK